MHEKKARRDTSSEVQAQQFGVKQIKLDLADVRVLQADGSDIYISSGSLILEIPGVALPYEDIKKVVDLFDAPERELEDLMDQLCTTIDDWNTKAVLLSRVVKA